MSSDPDKVLMQAVLLQVDGKLDYKRLAQGLGMKSAQVAGQRWRRFRDSKLLGGKLATPRATNNVTPTKNPNGSSKGKQTSISTGNGKQANASKKRKAMESSDVEEEELNWKDESSEDEFEGAVKETPSRKLPARKARKLSFKEFKEEISEEDDNSEDEDFQVGHGSAYGAMKDIEKLGGDSGHGSDQGPIEEDTTKLEDTIVKKQELKC